jgi:hypothetical protein
MGKWNTHSAHIEWPTDEEHWFAFFQQDYTLTSTCLIQGTRQQNVYTSNHNTIEKNLRKI